MIPTPRPVGFLTSDRAIKIGTVLPRTAAEGPGYRFAVWVQGCSIRCDGCFNPHFWSSSGGSESTPSDLADDVLREDVEGVTLLGGEPFEQADVLAEFAGLVRAEGLSVMTFTGFTREHLESSRAPRGAAELLRQTDLLIDGPYIAEAPDRTRPWVGSRNQGFHFLTDRYRGLEARLSMIRDRVEVRITPAGEVQVNGWATIDQLDELLAGSTPIVGRGRVR